MEQLVLVDDAGLPKQHLNFVPEEVSTALVAH